MELKDIDIFDLDGYQRRGIPHDQFEYLRENAPVYFHPEPQQELRPNIPPTGFWCITKHADVVHVSRNPEIFSSQRGGTNIFDVSPAELARITLMLINMDPPHHVRLRRLIKTGFSPRMVRNMTPQVRRAVRETIDDVIEKGECDFVESVAAEISLKILCDVLGVPREDRQLVYDWTNWLMFFDDPDSPATAEEMLSISQDIWAYASALAKEKQKNPGHDITSILQAAEVDGRKLSELEYNMFFLMLLVAGNETTRTGISQGLRLLLEHPDQWALLKSNPDKYLATAVDEILRFEPPVISFRRTATQDTELRGQQIKEGDKVVMWYSAANRDPEVFEDPLTFDITREHNPHLSFGMGEHFCLGSHVARLEMTETFRELALRMPDVEAVAPPERFRSNFLNGFKHYYIRFTPGERLGWNEADEEVAA
ncbi:MAG: cytochrome P450 [Candidatus Dadabacteria bacterium]|nr:MAG: cytochrome P450 [Candidatus Dadabacteria bacterium]